MMSITCRQDCDHQVLFSNVCRLAARYHGRRTPTGVDYRAYWCRCTRKPRLSFTISLALLQRLQHRKDVYGPSCDCNLPNQVCLEVSKILGCGWIHFPQVIDNHKKGEACVLYAADFNRVLRTTLTCMCIQTLWKRLNKHEREKLVLGLVWSIHRWIHFSMEGPTWSFPPTLQNRFKGSQLIHQGWFKASCQGGRRNTRDYHQLDGRVAFGSWWWWTCHGSIVMQWVRPIPTFLSQWWKWKLPYCPIFNGVWWLWTDGWVSFKAVTSNLSFASIEYVCKLINRTGFDTRKHNSVSTRTIRPCNL
jgi:hypothetical protein